MRGVTAITEFIVSKRYHHIRLNIIYYFHWSIKEGEIKFSKTFQNINQFKKWLNFKFYYFYENINHEYIVLQKPRKYNLSVLIKEVVWYCNKGCKYWNFTSLGGWFTKQIGTYLTNSWELFAEGSINRGQGI